MSAMRLRFETSPISVMAGAIQAQDESGYDDPLLASEEGREFDSKPSDVWTRGSSGSERTADTDTGTSPQLVADKRG